MTSEPINPSREELLKELESIHDSLASEGLKSDPLDTESAASSPSSPASHNTVLNSTPDTATSATSTSATDAEPATPPRETSEVDTQLPDVAAESTPENTNKDHPMHVLPGQQSLFEEGKSNDSSDDQPPHNASAIEPTVIPPQASPEVKENPFLPRHIKQKLEKEKSLYQQQVDESIQASAASKPRTPYTSKEAPQENETLIDELVAEYLPKIEKTLRQRLRQKLEQAG
ncbi:MAG: hypothetical protein K6L76_09760 [Agarilytica sp.]